MFWIFIWILLSSVLIGATVWSQTILLRQKKAWEEFARRRKFIFRKGTFMGPAEMSGVIDEYRVSFYTAERTMADARSKKYVSVMEIELGEGLIDGGVAGTKEMQTFMQSLTQIKPYPVTHEGWDPTHSIFVRHDSAANAYFTPDRLDVFSTVLKTRNADVAIIFTDKDLVLRMETSDPMQDAAKIEKIVTRQIALANKMRITPEQRAQYMALVNP